MNILDKSWLRLANSALSKVNENVLQSLDSANTSALLCRELIPNVVGQILQMNDWKCAKKRVQLPKLAEGVVFGDLNQFLLPDDFVRIFEIANTDDWTREGNTLLSSASYINLIYIAIPETPNSLDHIIIAAIISLLASNLVFSLTGDSQKSSFFYQEAMNSIQLAKTYEQAGEKSVPIKTNNWRDFI